MVDGHGRAYEDVNMRFIWTILENFLIEKGVNTRKLRMTGMYADDTAIIAESPHMLQKGRTALEEDNLIRTYKYGNPS